MKRQENFDRQIANLTNHLTLSNLRILEIGGDRWRYVSNKFVDAGAEHVETINIVPGWPDQKFVAPKIYSRQLDCRKLTECYPLETFDLVFGIAVGEHISGIDLFLAEAEKVLKPNGFLYIHGGPVWSATKGHHLYHKVGDRLFTFHDSDCPINRWEHLMYDRQELARLMSTRGVESTVASQLADWVFDTDEQNRLVYSKLTSLFDSCSLELVQRIDNAFFSPSDAELEAIVANGYDPEDRYDVSGVIHIMRKS
ncbi:MAG: class I SAM-dependent methyltransferase [Alphaproteobacteria bacterium]|nr:class I SAM-dependent methyltransferase [Alphaproteobacteria bacterium]